MGRIDSLITSLESTLQPWRAFLIAIDGRGGVGKSPLGRRLSLELKLPLIETDLYLNDISNTLEYHSDELKRVINTRLNKNRPVIVEGIFIRQILKQL
jgi:adenylate kinase family enzyme